MRTLAIKYLPIVSAMMIWAAIESDLAARNFRPGMTPNGSVFNCQTCHVSPFGGSARNVFGNAVNLLVTPNGNQAFWSPTLAAMDSDGDGFSNGLELGDVNGDGVPERNTGISNPGDASSTPILPNTAPSFTSTPIAAATKGVSYQYQAAADDDENNTVTFAKVSGPTWLTVAANGLVSGTPPDNANAIEAIKVRAVDNGSPPASADQSYNLNITASFLGWQRLNFGSGENDSNAGAAVIGPGRIHPNLIKYARRGTSQTVDSLTFPLGIGAAQPATFSIDVRNDDPALTVIAEISNKIDFSNPTTVNAISSDPTPNDGFKRLTFTDAVSNGSGIRRFVRLKFSN
jgi:hypothetical protein